MKASAAMVLAAVAALAITSALPTAEISSPPSPKPAGPISRPLYQQLAVTCPKVGEQVSGMNRICFYNCVGSMTAITIGAAQICPVMIQG